MAIILIFIFVIKIAPTIIFCYEFCLVGYTIFLNVCFLEW